MSPRFSTRAGGAILVQPLLSPPHDTGDGATDGTDMGMGKRKDETMRRRDWTAACFRRLSDHILCSFRAFARNRIYRLPQSCIMWLETDDRLIADERSERRR